MINLALQRFKQRGSKLQNVDEVYEFLEHSFSQPEMYKIGFEFNEDETEELGNFFEGLAQKWGIPFNLRLMLGLVNKNMAYDSNLRFEAWMVMAILTEIRSRCVASLSCNTPLERLEDFLTFDDISEHLKDQDEFIQRTLTEINSISGKSWHEKLTAYTEWLEKEDRIQKF